MARLIELKPDERPPSGGEWAMVIVHAEGVESAGPVIRHNLGATFFTCFPKAEVDRAIDKAMAWADAHSVARVYVRHDRA